MLFIQSISDFYEQLRSKAFTGGGNYVYAEV